MIKPHLNIRKLKPRRAETALHAGGCPQAGAGQQGREEELLGVLGQFSFPTV